MRAGTAEPQPSTFSALGRLYIAQIEQDLSKNRSCQANSACRPQAAQIKGAAVGFIGTKDTRNHRTLTNLNNTQIMTPIQQAGKAIIQAVIFGQPQKLAKNTIKIREI
jgi:hypothetical protein